MVSFRTKTIIGIASIEAILLSILIWSSLSFLSRSNEKALLDYANTTAKLFATTTKDAVLSTDLASLESFIYEVLSNRNIVYARVLNADNIILAEAGNANALAKRFKPDIALDQVEDYVFDVYAEIWEGGINFGRVEVGLSIENITETMVDAKQSIVSIALVEILLTALFSLLLGFYLTRQLSDLRAASKKLGQGNHHIDLPVRGSDELAQTAACFNNMAKALDKKEKALIVAKEQAEELYKTKTKFLSSVSHELRTPLNAVLGFSQLLEMESEENFNEQQRQWLLEIIQSGELLLSLIDDILVFSSIESNRLSVAIETIEIGAIIDDACAMIKKMATENDVELQCPNIKQPTYIQADPIRIKQVLLNLMSNAIKYNKKNGKVQVKINEIKQKNSNIPRLKIEFLDTGIGLSDKQQVNIFDEFVRYNENTHTPGIGIGLSLAKNLTEQMGGEIGVISKKGEGSCFWVCFNLSAT